MCGLVSTVGCAFAPPPYLANFSIGRIEGRPKLTIIICIVLCKEKDRLHKGTLKHHAFQSLRFTKTKLLV